MILHHTCVGVRIKIPGVYSTSLYCRGRGSSTTESGKRAAYFARRSRRRQSQTVVRGRGRRLVLCDRGAKISQHSLSINFKHLTPVSCLRNGRMSSNYALIENKLVSAAFSVVQRQQTEQHHDPGTNNTFIFDSPFCPERYQELSTGTSDGSDRFHVSGY